MQTFRRRFLADVSHTFCRRLNEVCKESQIVSGQPPLSCGKKCFRPQTLQTFRRMHPYTHPRTHSRLALARGRGSRGKGLQRLHFGSQLSRK